MLEINKITVQVDGKQLLKDFSLKIDKGSIHVIMGPNGSGKSTLSRTIMGDPRYQLLSGKIIFNNQDLLTLTPDQRAREGIFLAFQNPLEIAGVSNADFLRTALGIKQSGIINLYEFIKKAEEYSLDLKIKSDLLSRGLNVGFSGGEKKKNEVLQLKILEPKFLILDEIDSGLDIDSLKLVFKNIKNYLKDYPETSVLIITHNNKILKYLVPDYVHIIKAGKIVRTGTSDLGDLLETEGYEQLGDEDENFK